MSIRSLLITVATVILLSLGGIIAIQHRLLGDARDELTVVRRDLLTLRTTVAELERDAAKTAERETVSRTAREAIISAPTTEDAGIAPVLLQGLRGADLIGSHQ